MYPPKLHKVGKGFFGQKIATDFLLKKGYQILAQNFRTRFSEIDIIAVFDNILKFIEVKTRFSEEYGPPEEAVTPRKLRLISKAAEYYKMQNPKTPEQMQIDVVAIEISMDGVVTRLELFENVTG